MLFAEIIVCIVSVVPKEREGGGERRPDKLLSPFWCTVPVQYVYEWFITQVTTNIAKNDHLIVESILRFVVGEEVNCSRSKQYFGNVQ